MNYNQFKKLSCYEEFEIQCALTGISKIDVLKEIGDRIADYYFFVSNDGIFNWFDLKGNHVEDPNILKDLKEEHIPKNIIKCIIPNSVTTISDHAFADCYSLKEITIPNHVTSIGNMAFYHCESLEEITIPNSVTSIGNYTFYHCESLTSITIPDSVRTIGHWIFSRCNSLTSITIPNSVTSIGNEAFYKCVSLTSITIPDSVRTIGHWAFYNCIVLKEVIFKGKTLDEVKQMKCYPWDINDESIIKCEI